MYNKDSIYLFFYTLFIKIPSLVLGKIKGNIVRTHWVLRSGNFGDCLSPYILKHYGLIPVHTFNRAKDEILLAGTILQWLPDDYSGYIIGSGGVNKHYDFPRAKVIAVRGKLTKLNFNNQELVLGDPGILMPLIFKKPISKIYKLGIVPHFVDENSQLIAKLKQRFGDDVLFINVRRDPKLVIDDIRRCENIVSSSLHGLILADAYGISNKWFVNKETKPDENNDFDHYKFLDYYSSIDVQDSPIELLGSESISDLVSVSYLKPKDKIETLQLQLNRVMEETVNKFKNNKR